MDVSAYTFSDSITINASPEDVYAIVSDVTRVGEQSPICKAASWDDPSQAGTQGAWFTGHNEVGEHGWDTKCEVVAAVPGKEFAFINHGPNGDWDLVRWGYVFEADGDGTKVTESWQVLPAYPDFILSMSPDADLTARLEVGRQRAHDGIPETLANLKKLAEA
jgi:uncharacterized protein YndB with AHSA1/START domain